MPPRGTFHALGLSALLTRHGGNDVEPRTLALLTLVVLAAPLALAETAGTIDAIALPDTLEAAPGTRVATVLLLHNTHPSAVSLQMSYHSPAADKVSYDNWTVTIPAGEKREVRATIVTDANATTARTIKLGGRDTAAGVDALVTVTLKPRLPTTATARDAPLKLTLAHPPELVAGVGGTIIFRIENLGETAHPATLKVSPPRGFALAEPPPTQKVPARGRVEVPVELRDARPEATLGEVAGAAYLAEAPAVTELRFMGHVVAPPAPPPSQGPGEAAAAATEALPATLPGGAALAATASVGSLAALAWATRRKWSWILLALYTRLRPQKLLESPVRAKVVALVKERPGITFGELQRRLGVGAGTLTHHARMLEKGGILFSSPDGQQRRFYHVGNGYVPPVGSVGERALDALAQGPKSATELASILGVSRQLLHYHVKKLVAQGKVQAVPDGRDLLLTRAA